MFDIFAFDQSSFACDQITEMPDSHHIIWIKVRPYFTGQEAIYLLFIWGQGWKLSTCYLYKSFIRSSNSISCSHFLFTPMRFKYITIHPLISRMHIYFRAPMKSIPKTWRILIKCTFCQLGLNTLDSFDVSGLKNLFVESFIYFVFYYKYLVVFRIYSIAAIWKYYIYT